MSEKFTPGPWDVIHEFNVIGPNFRGVATTGGYANNTEQAERLHEESVANAKLIAAAPDLVSTLHSIIENVDSIGRRLVGRRPHPNDIEWAKTILDKIDQDGRAAIKKATE